MPSAISMIRIGFFIFADVNLLITFYLTLSELFRTFQRNIGWVDIIFTLRVTVPPAAA